MRKINISQRTLILLIIGILLVCCGLIYILGVNFSGSKFGVVEEDTLIRVPADSIPADTLYITEDRRYYQRGKMTLVIPSIEAYTPIGESTLPQGLKEMPGLYEFSQMPGEGDVNVSIAGHRDIHDSVFLYLDKVQDGDFAYLIHESIVFRYRYKETKVVKPTAWEVIKPQGFSCLTLTTCDPIGTTRNRLIVTLELVDYQRYAEDYQFFSNNGEQTDYEQEVMK